MKNLYLSVLSTSLLLIGCGGSNSDGSNVTSMNSSWAGALTKIKDTCVGSVAPQVLNFRHEVRQNQQAIFLSDGDGHQYIGNTVGEGFSVDYINSVGTQCSLHSQIRYSNANSDSDTTADIELTTTQDCAGNGGCVIDYTGTGSRGRAAETPTSVATAMPGQATPGATPIVHTTPIAGGCPAMNPNPAAGTYHGNGGCGISDTLFRLSPEGAPTSVILEPFGANGATSFSINGANSSSAIAVRTDLTVKGDAGYSCSMACSAPGTFTVTCFKEGATQCVEKF